MGVTWLLLVCGHGVLAEDLGVRFLLLTRTDWTVRALLSTRPEVTS